MGARSWGLGCGLLLVAGLVTRGSAARADVDEWASAGRRAKALVTQTREAMAEDEAGELPALASWFERTHAGAYLFQWGVADRFRPPFELSPRPVWPLRPLFSVADSQRPDRFVPRQGLIRPEEHAASKVPSMPVSVDGLPLLGPLVVGSELVLEPGQPDPGPVLELWGALPSAQRIEFVLYTELGYEPGVWSTPSVPEPVAEGPFGAGQRRRISLRDILLCADSFALFQAAVQAEDLGARHAYLEVRAVDDEEGIAHRVLAASAWIELELEPGLAQLMLR